MNRKKEIENDLWLASQLERIRDIQTPRPVDVTDAVMERIATLPTPMGQPVLQKKTGRRIATAAAAACVAGAVIVTALLSRNDLQAATPVQQDISYRIYEIYDYCHDYADEESIESAAYFDNPITELI